jgi:phenylpropionate dioxygenase-like ring-hydroxylating dioxygenase large terminal subunit
MLQGTLTYTHLDPTQIHTDSHTLELSSSQIQYKTQWSRVLRSDSLNHSKPLRVHLCSSTI